MSSIQPIPDFSPFERNFLKRFQSETVEGWKNEILLNIFNYLEVFKGEGEKLWKELAEDLKEKSLQEVQNKWNALKDQKYLEDAPSFFMAFLNELNDVRLAPVLQKEVEGLDDLLQKQGEWKAVRKDEYLRLLIDIKKRKYPDFEAYVVREDELPVLLQMIKNRGLKECRLLIRNEVHYTAVYISSREGVIRNEVHYTAVYISSREGEKFAWIMDASQDPKHLSYLPLFEKNGYQISLGGINEEDKLQLDERSCSIFTFSQVVGTVKTSLPEQRVGRTSWNDLSPLFSKLSQLLHHESPGEKLAKWNQKILNLRRETPLKTLAEVAFKHPFSLLTSR